MRDSGLLLLLLLFGLLLGAQAQKLSALTVSRSLDFSPLLKSSHTIILMTDWSKTLI